MRSVGMFTNLDIITSRIDENEYFLNSLLSLIRLLSMGEVRNNISGGGFAIIPYTPPSNKVIIWNRDIATISPPD